MTRFTLDVQATLQLPSSFDVAAAGANAAGYGLQFGFAVGDGPTQFVLGPQSTQQPISLRTLIERIAKMLGIDALKQIAHLSSSLPWSKIFAVEIAPYLTVSIGEETAVQLVVKLFEKGDYGIKLGGNYGPITVEPNFTVYDLIVGYDKSKGGLDVSARVQFSEQESFKKLQRLEAGQLHRGFPGRVLAGLQEDEDKKTSVVSYPFPIPSQGTSNFQVKYLGLGQRFGPTADLTKDDPIKEMFNELESVFITNDPRKLLEGFGKYYDPTRDWFVAAHLLVRG
jgi:hypothetical protein